MSNKLYKHVCFKDLEAYFKISDYFSNLTLAEKQVVRKNLGISSGAGYAIMWGTYSEIKELVDNKKLEAGNIYIMTDFLTIHKTNNEDVFKSNVIYNIVLNAITNYQFDSRVLVLQNDKLLNWEVRYDFQQELINDTFTKGKITYLEDEFGNSAYYDFKNSVFYRDVGNVGGKYLPTFSINVDGEFVEASEHVSNIKFDNCSYNNVFIIRDSCDGVVLNSCINNTFISDINNSVINVKNKIVVSDLLLESLIKTDLIDLGDECGISYLDVETLTKQFIKYEHVNN